MVGKLTLAILLLVVVIGGVVLFNAVSKNPIKTAGVVNNPEENAPALKVDISTGLNVIEITSSGFAPSTLTISKGDAVTFTNRDTEEHWPASAIHPTHQIYPESGGCIGSKFDACHGLAPGESWSFIFNEVGSWGYHDHLDVNLKGKIVVSE